MSFRARLLWASLPLALVPLVLFGLTARREVTSRLEAQYAERVAALAAVVGEELENESARVAASLERVAQAMTGDARLRLALLGDPAARPYLLDYASREMPLAGLDLLRIQDAHGRVLSSGHFRNEFGAVDTVLAEATARESDEAVLAEVATPSGTMLVLARAVPVTVGAERFLAIGGSAVDEAFLSGLSRGTGLEVSLRTDGGAGGAHASPADAGASHDGAAEVAAAGGGAAEPGAQDGVRAALVREVAVPMATPQGESLARFVVRGSDAPLVELTRDLDVWLLGSAAVAALLALVLAVAIAAQLAGPLAALARGAGRIDLDQLDVGFASKRNDEIGELSRVLQRMTARLRASAVRLREAERRAATGEIARQVHHDVRNGLIPIRNVLSHLAQLARESPARLPEVFLEREGTLSSSVEYLQSLATRYARLSPPSERRVVDANEVARQLVADAAALAGSPNVHVEADLAAGAALVLADPVALRRVLENLVVNGVESLGDAPALRRGRVLVWTRISRSDHGDAVVRVGVSDDGRGMSEEQRARMFDDFYTTKAQGTGLGLSIVRRLVGDMGGRIEVESAPGEGTVFTVELPAAGRHDAEPGERMLGEARGAAAADAEARTPDPPRPPPDMRASSVGNVRTEHHR